MKSMMMAAAAIAAAMGAPAGAAVYNYSAQLALDPGLINAAGNYVAALSGDNIVLNPMDQVIGTIRFADNGRLTVINDAKPFGGEDVTATFGGGLSSFYWTITGLEGEYLRPAYQEGSCSDLCFTTFGDLTTTSFSFTGTDFRLLYRGDGPVTFDPQFFVVSSARIGNVDAVPEPAAWAMLIAGFGLIGAASRRRARVSTVSA